MGHIMGEGVKFPNSVFEPICEDFADFDVPIRNCLNFWGILEALQVPVGVSHDIFVFRSELRENADVPALLSVDERALLALEDALGFKHYEPGQGLSYCVWQNISDADVAHKSKEHLEAVRYAPIVYKKAQLTWVRVARLFDGAINYKELSQKTLQFS